MLGDLLYSLREIEFFFNLFGYSFFIFYNNFINALLDKLSTKNISKWPAY